MVKYFYFINQTRGCAINDHPVNTTNDLNWIEDFDALSPQEQKAKFEEVIRKNLYWSLADDIIAQSDEGTVVHYSTLKKELD